MPSHSNSTRPEILAPAGNADMLCAAVFAGADAVYLGLQNFNARRTAGNFTTEGLRQAVAFCHARDVRVYVTLNTTLYPGELTALAEAVAGIAAAGADAVITQDLAVAALVRRMAPGLALHGSTQMSVQSLDGARRLAALGFTRVILARELTLSEIAGITAGCGIETETFVHGALCMSVSGQCYMSAFLGGRSGNRGGCAGPCRLPFDASGTPGPAAGHHLSLKDMSVIGHLPQLSAAGVASVKIEGRLRPPEYVAAAVNACLLARAGEPYDTRLLQDVFSRSGFTDSYLTGARNGSMFGTRTEGDAAAAKAAAPRLRELYRRERPRVGVGLELTLEEDGAKLAVRDADGNRAVVYGERQPQPGQKPPEEARAAYRRSLEKMGGTPFFPQEVAVRGAQWFLPGSEVNELRRRALESLLAKREQPRPIPCAKVPQALLEAPARAAKQEGYAVRLAHAAQLPRETPQDAAWFIMPLAQWRDVPPELRSRTWLEAPRALFGGAEEASARAAFESRDAGFAGYVAENIAQFTTLEGLPLAGGFGLNVTNPLSAKEYAALGARMLTLSPELTLEDMARISAPVPALALAYGHMPLMLTRACPLQNVRDCGGCDRKGELLDRKGMRFPVRCSGPAGARTVYNPIPIYMGDRLKELPVELPLLYFTIETAARVREVLALVREGLPFDGPFTRGLYYKGTNCACRKSKAEKSARGRPAAGKPRIFARQSAGRAANAEKMGGCCARRRVPERCRASCADAAPRARSLCAKMLFHSKCPAAFRRADAGVCRAKRRTKTAVRGEGGRKTCL